MASAGCPNLPEDSSTFAREEYRRACRTRFDEEQKFPPGGEDIMGETPGLSTQDEGLQWREEMQAPQAAPVANPLVAGVTKSTNGERRNSFSKVMSYCSGIFKKSDSGARHPPLTPQEREKAKAAQRKQEQDARMAHLIAQLEFEGKSDAEIQSHLFHLRDMAQYARPKSNSLLGEWFCDMSQAFKDGSNLKREHPCVTIQVSSVNPFTAAMPANYVHGLGYSYEELLALESVPRGLHSVDHLSEMVYNGQELFPNQTTCAICMCEFEIDEKLRCLTCTHYYHKECIDKWLSVAPSCPMCKQEVNKV